MFHGSLYCFVAAEDAGKLLRATQASQLSKSTTGYCYPTAYTLEIKSEQQLTVMHILVLCYVPSVQKLTFRSVESADVSYTSDCSISAAQH